MSNKKLDRTKAPFAKGIPEFSFPAYKERLLNNGIKVIIIEDNSQPLVHIRLSVNCGASSEPTHGLAYLTAQLLTKGTKNAGATQIAAETDLMGTSMSSGASWDDTSMNMVCLSDHINKSLSILADCYSESLISEDELERLRKRHISNIRQEHSDPGYLAQVSFDLVYFREHPYGHPLYGNLDSIKNIQREDCLKWYKGILKKKPLFVVAGNVNADEISALLEKYFGQGKYNATETDGTDDKEYTQQKYDKKIITIDKPDLSQATLKLGMPSIKRQSPDFPYAHLVNVIYGGYFLSRLNYLLRETLGYTYGIYSFIQSRKHASTLIIGANVNKGHTADSINKIIEEMEKISNTAVKPDELDMARQYILGSFVRSIETPRQISTLLYTLEINRLSDDYYNRFFSMIASATPESLTKVQKKYFRPDGLVVAAVGNTETLKPQFEQFDDVSYYKGLDEIG